MRITYVTYFPYYNSFEKGGVKKKVQDQIYYLRESGNDVEHLVLDPYAQEREHQRNPRIISSNFGLVTWPIDLLDGLYDTLLKQEPEIIYVRHLNGIPGVGSVLKRMSAPVVIEVNGDFESGTLEKKEYGKYLAEITFGRNVLSSADGIVGVTPEIVKIHKSRLSDKCKKWAFIGNGYNNAERHPFPDTFETDETYRLCFLGRGRPWNGIDRVLEMLRREQPENFVLHWCSDYSYEDFDIPSNHVVKEGYVDGEELANLLYRCDAGIGSLAMFRGNRTQATSLKVRTYLIHGLPVILGHDDPDLSNNLPFIQKVPASEAPLDIDLVRDFLDSVKKNSNLRRNARTFAETHLTYKTKMKKLEDFLMFIKRTS